MTPAINDLLRGAPADAKLQTTAGNQIRRTGILGHVHRVFIAHINHAGTDLDGFRFGPNCGQQRERRAQLTSKVVHAKIGAVRPQLFGRYGQVDGLQQGVCCRARAGLRRRRPVTKR